MALNWIATFRGGSLVKAMSQSVDRAELERLVQEKMKTGTSEFMARIQAANELAKRQNEGPTLKDAIAVHCNEA